MTNHEVNHSALSESLLSTTAVTQVYLFFVLFLYYNWNNFMEAYM